MSQVQKMTPEEQVLVYTIKEIFHVMHTATPNEQDAGLLRVIRVAHKAMTEQQNGED